MSLSLAQLAFAADPTITSVDPSSGPSSGFTTVTLTGTDLDQVTDVTFGGLAANITSQANNAITLTTPAHAPGTAPISVVTPSTSVSAGNFTYIGQITLSPTTLPSASVGTPYSMSLTVSGGAAPYVFIVTSGSLPTGLFFSSAGTLSGTPTVPGSFPFTITGEDSVGNNGSRAYVLTVNAAPPPPPGVTGVSPPTGPPTGNITVTITGSNFAGASNVSFGGTPAMSFTVTSASSITATVPPSSPGAVDVSVTTASGTGALSSGFTYLAPSIAVTPTPGNLPPGIVGSAYSQSFTASGGTAPYTYSFSSGTLPPGLTFSNGTLAGTPASSGSFSFTIQAADSGGYSTTAAYTLAVAAPAPTLSSVSPSSGPLTGGTSVTLTGTGFTSPAEVSFGGVGAASVTVHSATSITAVTPPHAAGAVSVTVTRAGGTASLPSGFTYTTAPTGSPLTLPTGALPGGMVAAMYGHSLTVSGGTAPYTYAVSAGALPAGITLHPSTGALSGIPATASTSTFTVLVTDSLGSSTSASYTLTVGAAATSPSLSGISPTSGAASGGTSVTLTGSGFTGATAVTFGGLAAGSFTVTSDTSITAVAPAHAAGVVPVVVTTSGGTVTLPSAFTYGVSTLPTAGPVAANVTAGSSRNAIALAVGGGATSVAVATQPANGSATASGTTITYTPAAGFAGQDAFTYTASSAEGTSPPATVTITVVAPQITLTPSTLPPAIGGTGYGPVALTASGGSGTYAFTISQGTLPPGLALAPGGSLSGTPTAAGSFPFTVSASDSSGFSGTQAYVLTVTGAVPVAQNKQVQLLAGTAATVALTTGATGGPFVGAAIATPPPAAAGTATISDGGGAYNLVFASTASAAGTVVVAYTLSNSWGASTPATVTFTVTPRPDPSKDQEVIGLVNARAQTAQQLATSQIRNFNDRLERLHREETRHSDPMNVRVGITPQSASRQGATDYPDSALPYAPLNRTADPSNAIQLGSAGDSGKAPASPGGALAFWTGGFVNFGTNTSNNLDISQTMVGMSAGVDLAITHDFIAGIGLGYGRNSADIGVNGTDLIGQAFSAALYGSYHPGGNIFIDALLGYGYLDLNNERYVTATGDFATGGQTGNQIFASLTASYEHRSGALLLSPYGRAELTWSQLQGFTETGAGYYNLTYGDQTFSTLAGVAGLRMEYEIPTSWSLLTTRARIEYTHNFGNSSTAAMGYADLANGLPYALEVDPLDDNYATFGLGLDARLPNGVTVGLDYRGMVGFSGNDQSQTFSARIRSQF